MKIDTLLFSIAILITLFSSNNALAETNTATIGAGKIQAKNGEYVRKRFLPLMKKPFVFDKEKPKQAKILIIGDSHAQDFLNAIIENNYLSNTQISTRYIPTRCQIYLGKNPQEKWLAIDKQLCEKSDNLELAKPQINNADVVILAAFWRKWAAEALPTTINNLGLMSNQRLFVIGRRSFRKIESSQIQNLNQEVLRKMQNEVDNHQLEINGIMKNTLDENVFVNVHQLICGQGSKCPIFTEDLKMISFDGGHLSQAGAKFIGRKLFQQSQLKLLITDK